MTGSPFLAQLERRYAITLGEYEFAERPTEKIVGLKALAQADVRITAEKVKLKARLERIADTIRRLYEPDWTPGHIQPVRPQGTVRRAGELSKKAYVVLRDAKAPMTTREVTKIVVAGLGLVNPDSRAVDIIHNSLHATFGRRAKDGEIVRHEGKPIRWSVASVRPRD